MSCSFNVLTGPPLPLFPCWEHQTT